MRDLRLPLPDGAHLRILRVGDDEALPVLRHSTAHVLAEAVKNLWPGTKVAIGPAIEDGFYYDFDFAEPPGEGDLARIEDEMRRSWRAVRIRSSASPAREPTRSRASAPRTSRTRWSSPRACRDGEAVTFYEQDGFVDLCRGPHLQTTKPIKAFKLTSLAGAYWRGDPNKPMLTRIYGAAFFDQAALDAHLERIEEAASPTTAASVASSISSTSATSSGIAVLAPAGTVLFNELGRLWRELNASRG